MDRPKLIQLIHVGKSKLKLNDDAYRSLLVSAVKKDSCTSMSVIELELVLRVMRKLGFASTAVRGRKKIPTRRLDVVNPGVPNDEHEMAGEEQIYYIKGLWALFSRSGKEESLLKFIKRIAKVDHYRFLERARATKIILALRVMCEKAGYDPDTVPRKPA